MARIKQLTSPSSGVEDKVYGVDWNALRLDYLSQTATDIDPQAIASDLDFASGKRPKFDFVYFNPSSAPAATEGHVYYDNTTKRLKVRNDVAWLTIPGVVEGSFSIVFPYTSATVTHNKGVANYPQLTPMADLGGNRYWVDPDNIGVNSFICKLDSIGPGGSYSFLYRV